MKYFRRFAFFAAKTLVIGTICISLLIYAFYIAFNFGCSYILVTEGLEKRVDVCLTREDYTALNSYFSASFLNADPVLNAAVSESSPYYPYDITSFDYEIKLTRLRWSPGSGTVTCLATERVTNITGTVKAEFKTVADPEITRWKSSRYTVTLHRQSDGSWKITGLEQDNSYKDADYE